MQYQVRFVENSALPEANEWAFLRTPVTTYLFVKQSAIDAATGRCDALTRAWEVWQESEALALRRGLRGFANPIALSA